MSTISRANADAGPGNGVGHEAAEESHDPLTRAALDLDAGAGRGRLQLLVDDRQRRRAVERLHRRDLEQVRQAGHEPPACVEFRGRRLRDHAQLAARQVRHEEHRDAVRGADAAALDQVEQSLGAQHAADLAEFRDDRLDALLPLAEVLHPRDEPAGRREPELALACAGHTLRVLRRELFGLLHGVHHERRLADARLADEQDVGFLTVELVDERRDLTLAAPRAGESLAHRAVADRLRDARERGRRWNDEVRPGRVARNGHDNLREFDLGRRQVRGQLRGRQPFELLENVSLDELRQVRAIRVVEADAQERQVRCGLAAEPRADDDGHAHLDGRLRRVHAVLPLVLRAHANGEPPQFRAEEVRPARMRHLPVVPAQVLAEVGVRVARGGAEPDGAVIDGDRGEAAREVAAQENGIARGGHVLLANGRRQPAGVFTSPQREQGWMVKPLLALRAGGCGRTSRLTPAVRLLCRLRSRRTRERPPYVRAVRR